MIHNFFLFVTVFLLLSTPNVVRKILLEASELQMYSEYAFVAIEMIKNKKAYGEFNWYRQGKFRLLEI